MKKYALLVYLFVINSVHVFAQEPCRAPETSQFDFWVGEWNLTYNDTVKATNSIARIMNDCVIYEKFNDPSTNFSGTSWSVYNANLKIWQQTWVDISGGYIVLTGTFSNNRMVLSTIPSPAKDGGMIQNRMIFYNITPGSFDWNWESTQDEGKTWKLLWKIHYERKD